MQDGVLVVGGNSKYDVSFDLHALAKKQQGVMGVSKGTKEQLQELVELVADKTVRHCIILFLMYFSSTMKKYGRYACANGHSPGYNI